jgi:hypothetical protein
MLKLKTFVGVFWISSIYGLRFVSLKVEGFAFLQDSFMFADIPNLFSRRKQFLTLEMDVFYEFFLWKQLQEP